MQNGLFVKGTLILTKNEDKLKVVMSTHHVFVFELEYVLMLGSMGICVS